MTASLFTSSSSRKMYPNSNPKGNKATQKTHLFQSLEMSDRVSPKALRNTRMIRPY